MAIETIKQKIIEVQWAYLCVSGVLGEKREEGPWEVVRRRFRKKYFQK